LEDENKKISLKTNREDNIIIEGLTKEVTSLQNTIKSNAEIIITNTRLQENLKTDTTALKNIMKTIYPSALNKEVEFIFAPLTFV
jgi:hypothetical protein